MFIKKNIKRFAAILLTGAMIVSMMTGCSSKGTETKEDESVSTAKSDGKTENSEGTENNTTEEVQVTYPLETDQTLSLWVAGQLGPQQSYTDYTQSPFHTGMAKMTGVDMEWQSPSIGSDNTQAYNLLLTEEELPDIIYWPIAADGNAQSLIDEGVIRDLTEVLPKYAPNYWAYLQKEGNEHMDKSVKTDEGAYYGFGSFRETEWGATYAGPVIRKDWLDELGLDIPSTIKDWDNVLRQFKEKYNATFGFFRARMSPGIASGFSAYGSFLSSLYLDDNQKVQMAQTQPEWKNYMEQMNQWYEAGLIDPDVPTVDDAGMRTKALNGDIGIAVTSIAQMSNWIADAELESTGAEWIGIPYPVQNIGDVVNTIQAEDTVSSYVATVSTSCTDEELETALRWLDYGFTEEGYLYWNYGTEGESYTMVDGKPVFTDTILAAPEGINEALIKYTGSYGAGIAIQATDMVKQKNKEAAVTSVDTWLKNNEHEKHLYPVGASMTTEESNEYGSIASSINTYVEEMSLKFMMGEESLDKYDEFVNTLVSMGVDRMLEIKQAAYDRFLER